VTDIERRTLQYALSTLKFTKPSAEYLRRMLENGSAEGQRGRIKVRWVWRKRKNSAFPAYPIVMPRKDHRFTLVLCHPLGWGGGFYLGCGALVEDFLSKSRLMRDHCKIVCPGGRTYKSWKMWFRYRGKDTCGTSECHAQLVNGKDFEQACEFVVDIVKSESDLLGSTSRIAVSGYSQGGCISQAVGLSLPYPVGLVISQRGMLMKHSMDEYTARGAAQKHRQRMLLTAGGRDDVYLPANQAEAKEWLIEQGMQVTFKLFEELNHGDHNKEEMAFIRSACTREFLKADSETKRSVQRMCSQEVVLQRAPSQLWAGQKRKPTPTAAAGSAASAAAASPRASAASGKRRRASRGLVDPAPERVGTP